jgi:hypothetical protein
LCVGFFEAARIFPETEGLFILLSLFKAISTVSFGLSLTFVPGAAFRLSAVILVESLLSTSLFLARLPLFRLMLRSIFFAALEPCLLGMEKNLKTQKAFR